MRRTVVLLFAVGSLVLVALGAAAGASARADEMSAVRAATARFHDVAAAERAGYGVFYVCTDEAGRGAMGQHYVNGELVGDAILDPARPEAVMFEPKPAGESRLVGVEWVVFRSAWDAAHPGDWPTLFGRRLTLVQEPNRYGLPAFYQLHAWIWKPNPAGTYEDWNPRVSCRGNGD